MSYFSIKMPEDKGVKYESFRYPGGEYQVRLLPKALEEIRASRAINVTARINTGEIMELALLTNAIHRNSSAYRTLILPYLPYGRADRAFIDGDCVGLAAFMKAIEALDYHEVRSVDTHNAAVTKSILSTFSNIPPDIEILQAVWDIGWNDLTILLPDKGARRYEEFFLSVSIPVVEGSKKRDPVTGKLSGFEAPHIPTSKVLIVDDICDGGGTFNGLADALGTGMVPHTLYLYVTHGIFSKGLEELSKRFAKVYTTDSIDWMPNLVRQRLPYVPDFVKVIKL